MVLFFVKLIFIVQVFVNFFNHYEIKCKICFVSPMYENLQFRLVVAKIIIKLVLPHLKKDLQLLVEAPLWKLKTSFLSAAP